MAWKSVPEEFINFSCFAGCQIEMDKMLCWTVDWNSVQFFEFRQKYQGFHLFQKMTPDLFDPLVDFDFQDLHFFDLAKMRIRLEN